MSSGETHTNTVAVTMTENFTEHVQKTVAKVSFLQRRTSPRLKNTLESTDSNTLDVATTKKFTGHIQKTVFKESSVQRRLSPRLKNTLESTDSNTLDVTMTKKFTGHIQKTVSKESSVQRRLSPRLKNTLESTDSNTLDVATTKKFTGHMQKTVSKESSVQRRLSPRLKNIPESKRPYYGASLKESLHYPAEQTSQEELDINGQKQNSSLSTSKDKFDECKNDIVQVKDKCSPHKRSGKNGFEGDAAKMDVFKRFTGCENGDNGSVDSATGDEKWLDCKYVPNAEGKSAYAMVKQTLRVYNSYFLHFVQEEEERCKKVEVDDEIVAKDLKRKKRDESQDDAKRSCKRPDLKAITKMSETNKILYPEKRFGHLSGIDIGHKFYSRAEMVALGFHSHWLNGIDYMGKTYNKLKEYKDYTFPLAVAVVLSGQYEDDQDNSEDIVYTGQGGNNFLGNKRQVKSQVMSGGNLALKNNMEQSIPVRLVRGHKSDHKACRKLYTYDGLYKVVEFWPEEGVSGFIVNKYRLKRLQGQPKLTTDQVLFVRERSLKVSSELPGLVCKDISGGQEDICIPATNLIDDAPVAPTSFTYCKSIQVAENVSLPPNANGCKCKGKCTNPKTCACARLNGFDFPYVRQNGGRLIEAKDVVFECGPNCGSGPNCINRISQKGMKYRLEVFRTPEKGWAVRTRDFIPSGAPVCEYIGMLKRTDELDNVAENQYIFEIDCWQTMKGIGGRERRMGDVSVSISNDVEKIDDDMLESTPEFCIDAGPVGNVARFINHSCEPNLFVQCVLSTHHDVRLAQVVLFSSDPIPPFQELTYDYGYALDSVVGPDGKIRELPCHCGTADCRKRLY